MELEQLSKQFRELYSLRESNKTQEHKDAIVGISVKGRDLLDILALTIRRELDDHDMKLDNVVGYLKKKSSAEAQISFLDNYRPNESTSGFNQLKLREACNKIAHTRIDRAGFFADKTTHHQILCGKYNGDHWIAVIDVLAFSQIIQSLPEIERPKTFGSFI